MGTLLHRTAFAASLAAAGLAVAAFSAPASAPSADIARFTAPSCDDTSPTAVGDPPTEDMTLPPEGIPHGATKPDGSPFSWALHPRSWRGNHPQPGWTSLAPTAMIYADSRMPSSDGVRVQVRNLELFVRPARTGQWCLLDRVPSPSGNFYEENFDGDRHVSASRRSEPGGGVSVHMMDTYNFHFWGDIMPIPDGGLTGIYVQYEARLIPENDGSDADVAKAAYLGAASSDYWKWAKAPPGHNGILNEDSAIGRFKRLSGDWRVFSMNTVGVQEMAPKAN